jgi:hypothetical protein
MPEYTILTNDGDSFQCSNLRRAVIKAESIADAEWVIEDGYGDVVESGCNYSEGNRCFGDDYWG